MSESRKEKRYRKELRETVQLCFSAFEREDEVFSHMVERLAAEADLSVSTVERLWYGWTQLPRFMTVQKIAGAAGLAVQLSEKGVLVSLAD